MTVPHSHSASFSHSGPTADDRHRPSRLGNSIGGGLTIIMFISTSSYIPIALCCRHDQQFLVHKGDEIWAPGYSVWRCSFSITIPTHTHDFTWAFQWNIHWYNSYFFSDITKFHLVSVQLSTLVLDKTLSWSYSFNFPARRSRRLFQRSNCQCDRVGQVGWQGWGQKWNEIAK